MSLSFASAIFWVAVALCAVAEIAIVRATLVARTSPVNGGVPRARRPVEVVWALVPALGLALVLGQTWRAIRAPAAGPGAAPAAMDAGTGSPSDHR